MSGPIIQPLAQQGSAPDQTYRKTALIHRIGLAAERPPVNEVLTGTLWHSSDTGATERSNGIEWETYFTSGLSSSVFFYRIDAIQTGVSDPGAGKLKYNNLVQTESNLMIVDWITDDGFDAHIIFQLFGATTRFLMQNKDFALNFQLWELTEPATNLADFFTVPVSLVSSGGSGTFSHNERVAVIILPPSATQVI